MSASHQREHPPIYTVLCEIVGWTLDRTPDFPKSQRFTFGQRLDNLSLDALQFAVKAIRGRQQAAKAKSLHELDSVLEQLRVLWRLVNDRGCVSRYIRVAEDCKTPKTLGLISQSKGDFWLWVKREPSASGANLYSSKDRSSFTPHKSNPDSTPRGGTGYLGGRKFPSLAGVKAYLQKFAPVVTC